MPISTFPEVDREVKRIGQELSRVTLDLRNLNDKVRTYSGGTSASPFLGAQQGGVSGIINAGAGLYGGGTLPGLVTLAVQQNYAFSWSGVHNHSANITLGAGITVDGVDISAHVHDGSADDAPQLDWDTVWSDAVHNHSADGEGGATIAATSFTGAATVSNTWTFSSTNKLQFQDTGLFIHGITDGNLQIESDAQLTLNAATRIALGTPMLRFTSAGTISTAANDLTVQAAGDIKLNPLGNEIIFQDWAASKSLESSTFVSHTTGWAISYGTGGGDADFRYIYADELHVKAFIAEIYSALAGALIITKSRARVSRDFTIPNTSSSATLYVEDHEGFENVAVFVANDYVLLRVIDLSGGGLIVEDVYGQVTSYTDLTGGEQSWTFTTTTTGYSSADVIYSGSVALDYGQTGSGSTGVWEATVLDSSGSPYSQTITWDTITAGEPDNFTVHTRVGNLDGISGVGLEYGLWAGQNTTNKYLLVSDTSFEVHGIAQTWYDGNDVARAEIDPTATGSSALFWLGPNSTSPGFTVSGDGDVWLSSLTVSDFGNPIFNAVDGILLLDCQRIKEIASTWYVMDSRGEKATLAGAIHQGQGRWSNTRGLVIEESTTNLITNPSLETAATGWAGAGGCTFTRTSTKSLFGDYSAKGVTDGVATGERIQYTQAALTGATEYTVSGWIKTPTGALMLLRFSDGVGASDTNFIGTGRWQRVQVIRTTAAVPTTTVISFRTRTSAQAITFYVDAAQVEQQDYATTYCDGSLGEGYTWSGTVHASTSARAITQVTLDGHADLLSDNTTWAMSVWVQMPYDYDATWPHASANYLWEVHEDANNRAHIYFDPTGPTLYARYIENSVAVSATYAPSFSAGDWLFLIMNVDTAGDIELLVNGVSQDTTDLSGRSNITTTEMNLGGRSTGAQPAGATYDDLALYDRILTAEEAGVLWAMNRPLIDTGATEKPGIYILDGEFKIMSSSSGERIEMDSAGMYGYDDSAVLQVAWYSSGDNAGMVVAGAGALKLTEDGIETHSTGDADTYNKFYNSDITVYTSAFGFLNLQKTQPDSNTYGVFNVGIRHDASNQTNMSCWFNEIDFFVEKGGSSRAVQEITYDYVRLNSVPFRPGTGTSDPTTSIEDGMIFYRTDTDKLRLRANGAWVDLN